MIVVVVALVSDGCGGDGVVVVVVVDGVIAAAAIRFHRSCSHPGHRLMDPSFTLPSLCATAILPLLSAAASFFHSCVFRAS